MSNSSRDCFFYFKEELILRSTLRRAFGSWSEFYFEACPICGHRGGCLIHDDGSKVACIRIESKKVFSTRFNSWLHYLKEDQVKQIEKSNIEDYQTSKKRDDNELNHIFRTMLEVTELSANHYNHLTTERELNNKQIHLREYRSFPSNSNQMIQEILNYVDGENLIGVPGFYKKGENYAIKGSNGLLIPFRNHLNQIVGFQYRMNDERFDAVIHVVGGKKVSAKVIKQPNFVEVRHEENIVFIGEIPFNEKVSIEEDKTLLGWVSLKKSKRYFWLSSANENMGTGAGPLPVHISVPTKKLLNWNVGSTLKAKSVWLSEGPLKCDIASDLVGELYEDEEIEDIGDTFIGLPGVAAWKSVLPTLEALEVENINICFDGDVVTNGDVAKHLKECMLELKKRGYRLTLVAWDQNSAGKGIDEVFMNRFIPKMKRLSK